MTEFRVVQGGKNVGTPTNDPEAIQTAEDYKAYIQSVTAVEGRADSCIDCDGVGTYPSGSTCLSCFGTGVVAPGDGIAQSPDRN